MPKSPLCLARAFWHIVTFYIDDSQAPEHVCRFFLALLHVLDRERGREKERAWVIRRADRARAHEGFFQHFDCEVGIIILLFSHLDSFDGFLMVGSRRGDFDGILVELRF